MGLKLKQLMIKQIKYISKAKFDHESLKPCIKCFILIELFDLHLRKVLCF